MDEHSEGNINATTALVVQPSLECSCVRTVDVLSGIGKSADSNECNHKSESAPR